MVCRIDTLVDGAGEAEVLIVAYQVYVRVFFFNPFERTVGGVVIYDYYFMIVSVQIGFERINAVGNEVDPIVRNNYGGNFV